MLNKKNIILLTLCLVLLTSSFAYGSERVIGEGKGHWYCEYVEDPMTDEIEEVVFSIADTETMLEKESVEDLTEEDLNNAEILEIRKLPEDYYNESRLYFVWSSELKNGKVRWRLDNNDEIREGNW